MHTMLMLEVRAAPFWNLLMSGLAAVKEQNSESEHCPRLLFTE